MRAAALGVAAFCGLTAIHQAMLDRPGWFLVMALGTGINVAIAEVSHD